MSTVFSTYYDGSKIGHLSDRVYAVDVAAQIPETDSKRREHIAFIIGLITVAVLLFDGA